MDDASSEHYSMFFIEEEGRKSASVGQKRLNQILVPENISYTSDYCPKDKIL